MATTAPSGPEIDIARSSAREMSRCTLKGRPIRAAAAAIWRIGTARVVRGSVTTM
jgi:hypothetical protein